MPFNTAVILYIPMLRSALSTCTLAFGVPRVLWHPAVPSFRSVRRKSTIFEVAGACSRASSGRRRKLCAYAAVTKAELQLVDDLGKKASIVEDFEDELDSMALAPEDEDSNSEKPCDHGPPRSPPVRISLLESNVRILERECDVVRRVREAAASRVGTLYLGLDVSVLKTGYAVLTPSLPGLANSVERGSLQEAAKADLVEWGCIEGSSPGSRKRDVVDVGETVEKALLEVTERCVASRRRGGKQVDDESAPPGVLESSEGLGEGRSQGEEDADGPVWVVAVEDFMRRFLPGRSSASSMFTLAQLNGIVKYTCRKHLGARAESVHPSRARSFYGLLLNRPEGKDMKEIVLEFALAHEPGGLQVRDDGSRPEGSYDTTDAYLIASYSWHQDLYRAMAEDRDMKSRFLEAFRESHADKLAAAEAKAIAMLMKGDMPAVKGKKKLKALTEREAKQAHRRSENLRLSKAFEAAMLHWFKDRVLGVFR